VSLGLYLQEIDIEGFASSASSYGTLTSLSSDWGLGNHLYATALIIFELFSGFNPKKKKWSFGVLTKTPFELTY
jgi:hypothetical protein